MNKLKKLIFLMVSALIVFSLTGGDCGNQTTEPPPKVAAPSNLELNVDAVPGGGSYALLFWTGSADESSANFKGYIIATYQLNASNQITSAFSRNRVPGNTHSFNVTSIQRGTKYKTYIMSELNDGTRSDSVSSEVYSGVYYNNDGVIDEYSTQDNTMSGYGWNTAVGSGNQYSFIQSNATSIDLHMRTQENALRFISPDQYLSGGRSTKFVLIGTGSDAFAKTDLPEPELSVINVADDNVYLLKTQDNNYIKIWISRIDLVNNLKKVYFEYKVQPVAGIRILKR